MIWYNNKYSDCIILHNLRGGTESKMLSIKEKRDAEFNECLQDIYQEVLLENIQSSVEIDVEKIRTSVQGLCDYLSHAIEIEQSIYKTEKRMRMLFDAMPMIEKNAKDALEKNRLNQKSAVSKEEEILKRRFKYIGSMTPKDFGLSLLPEPKRPTAPQPPIEPKYETPGFFNKRKVIAANAELEKQYKEELAKYQAAYEKYKLELAEYREQIDDVQIKNEEKLYIIESRREELEKNARKESEKKIALIKRNTSGDNVPEVVIEKMTKDEIDLAKDTYKQLLIAREQYYSPNIVFAKYRTLPALTTIYEYLMAGRCTTLEGANGAYNLYESEIRANMIISQLDTVIEKLDEIKNIQYTLCHQMSIANASLSRIDEKMDKACDSLRSISNNVSAIRDNSEVIKNNTAVIAYYTARTAFYSEMTATISAARMFGF